jgi:probable DNA metabolism protein
LKQITFEASFDAWQKAARKALAAGLAPEEIVWQPGGSDPSLDLFSSAEIAPEIVGTEFRVPPAFLALARTVCLHSDAAKWTTLYRVLWRLTHGEARLLENPVDADGIALRHWEKEVRKDAYRMQQYIRFRETRLNDEPWFVAWYEPQHDSVALNATFFSDRFANMRWSILTPIRCMHWDGNEITLSPGLSCPTEVSRDDVESLWVTYYSNIFNPARVKVNAMKAQMPVRNWKNLPEAAAIAPLLARAPLRVQSMVDRSESARVRDDAYGLAQPPLTDDWSELRQSAALCRACPLWRQATCVVFGEGPLDARVLLVGEQPGDSEDRAGKAFIGPAGQVLDRALAAAGIDRTTLYVTNAVKHFKWTPRGKRRIHQTPNAREIAACRPWLEAELKRIQPSLIVALGATAAKSLLREDVRVTQERGKFLPSPQGKVLVTIHPSALLRLPPGRSFESEFETFVADLRRIRDLG